MANTYDPIAPIAEEISDEACLLCFDEFQVNNKRLTLINPAVSGGHCLLTVIKYWKSESLASELLFVSVVSMISLLKYE